MSNSKKIKMVQVLRHLIQLIAFLAVPGLYVIAFSEIGSLVQAIVEGNVQWIDLFSTITELVVTVLASLLFGRFFCGYLCAFGAYNDLLHAVGHKVFKIRFKMPKKVDAILKYAKYLVLLAVFVITWGAGSRIFANASPWDAFGHLATLPPEITGGLVSFVFLGLITVGALFVERFFCRYLCPLGAVYALVSRIGIFRIIMPKDQCGACRACTTHCSMGISLTQKDSVYGGECINCMKCVEVCPRGNARASLFGTKMNKMVAVILAILLSFGVAFAVRHTVEQLTESTVSASELVTTGAADNGIESSQVGNTVNDSTGTTTSEANSAGAVSNGSSGTGTSSTASTGAETVSSGTASASTGTATTTASTNKLYVDGTYTGSGVGYHRGTTTLSVVIESDVIQSITTLSTEDTPSFYDRVEATMIQRMLSAQSSSVDAISGATFTSNGMMEAVQNALNQAAIQ